VHLLASVVKTWAPVGQTPVLHHANLHTHLSLISAVSPDGAFYYQIHRASFKSADMINFLTAVHNEAGRDLLVVWDGVTIHRSEEIKQFLRDGAAEWLLLERLPSYAPELNPDEGVWSHLKYTEMRNWCAQNLKQLEEKAKEILEAIKKTPEVILGCFKQAGLS
jgi:transposase